MTNNPPTDLGRNGAKLWRKLSKDVTFAPQELTFLHNACALEDAIAEMVAALEGQSLTVRGSAGQEVAHPLLAEIRQSRAAQNACLRQIEFPADEAGGGEIRMTNSERASMAAKARWSTTRKSS